MPHVRLTEEALREHDKAQEQRRESQQEMSYAAYQVYLEHDQQIRAERARQAVLENVQHGFLPSNYDDRIQATRRANVEGNLGNSLDDENGTMFRSVAFRETPNERFAAISAVADENNLVARHLMREMNVNPGDMNRKQLREIGADATAIKSREKAKTRSLNRYSPSQFSEPGNHVQENAQAPVDEGMGAPMQSSQA